jgi:hypothetical protein
MKNRNAMIPEGQIERSVLLIRVEKMIMDPDLAVTYGV